MTPTDLIAKPFSVYGIDITSRHIANAIDRLANLPSGFAASVLGLALVPTASGYERQEATNRLLQRWRKLDLAEFERGKWRLRKGAWDKLQAAAIDARK